MAELKTILHNSDVFASNHTSANTGQKREDSLQLMKLMQEFTGYPDHEQLLKDLGHYTVGKACIYIKKLSDIDQAALSCNHCRCFCDHQEDEQV